MKVLFMGTPDFSVPCLEKLINSGYEVCGVFTQPDKPKGRGYKLAFPPVKEKALRHKIPVFQPNKFKGDQAISVIKDLSPEIIVVVAYGKILPKEILDYPKYGCINVHASLLPKYRGAAPIQWSVINGEKFTGVTTMYMDTGLDTGDMLLKSKTDIGENETSGELHDRLSLLGANLLIETIDKILNDNIKRIKQNSSESSYSPMLDKSFCVINWNKSSSIIHNLVRGLNPCPTAFTYLDGKILKIHKTKISNMHGDNPGEVISREPFIVSCADNTALEITEIQLQGKRKMSSDEFLRGHNIEIGKKLGE